VRDTVEIGGGGLQMQGISMGRSEGGRPFSSGVVGGAGMLEMQGNEGGGLDVDGGRRAGKR
jgi:hypothetical protein